MEPLGEEAGTTEAGAAGPQLATTSATATVSHTGERLRSEIRSVT